MPALEFSVILKVLPRHETAAALKRIGSLLLEKGVILTKLENLGTRDLPYRMNKETHFYNKGSYFVYSFMGQRNVFPDIDEICTRDLDIIRHAFITAPKALAEECTLEKELLPPGERESVKELMEKSKSFKARYRPIRRHNTKKHNFFDIYM